jgi:dihydroorotase
MQYDTIITGGWVIDPGAGINAPMNLAIKDGLIAKLDLDLNHSQATNVIDARGKRVVPGLIDMHTHLYEHVTEIGTDPDLAGVRSGVTTLVDAGSAGSSTYEGFQHHVIGKSITRILSFIHLARSGLAVAPEIRNLDDVDLNATIAAIQNHKDSILGIKVRAVGPAVTIMGEKLIELAREAAKETGTKVMVHIGDPQYRVEPTLTRRLLPILQHGDIVTHMYTGAPGKVLDDSLRVLPEMLDARDREIVFDVGHGRFNFNFEVAERLLEQGVIPRSISTDITTQGRSGIVKSMTHIMNKFLALGFSLEEVINLSTYQPAGLIGMQEELGTLKQGTIADITILDEVEGAWTYVDSQERVIQGKNAIRPVLCFKGGEQFSVDYGPFPWGWLPNFND